MENTSAGPELPDEQSKSFAGPVHKPGKSKRLKAQYRTSTINPSRTDGSSISLHEDVQLVKPGDPVATLLSGRAPSRKPTRCLTLDTAVAGEEIENGASTPVQEEEDSSVPPTGQVFKSKSIPLIDKLRKTSVAICVSILFVVVVMSVLAASGVFKKDSPALPNDTNGNDDGNVGKPGMDDSDTTQPAPTFSPSATVAETPTAGSTTQPAPTFSPSATVTETPTTGSTTQPAPTFSPSTTMAETPTTGSTSSNPPVPVTYLPGLLTVEENGLLLSQGLISRIIARSGSNVPYSDGNTSGVPFHMRPDFGATFRVPDDSIDNKGGWVYVSNSEVNYKKGGVGAITFDKDGNVIHYEMLLEGTSMNCAGGKTPWETWISCEEVGEIGEIYQVDPFGRRSPEKLTMSTIQGGRYESFSYDDRNMTQPRFYVTEDQPNGPTRRWTPSSESIDWESNPWDMLHGNGTLEYLVLYESDTNSDSGTYEWVSSIQQARSNARLSYPGSEGIDRKDNFLYMVTKTERFLYVLDLDSNTYVRTSTSFGLFDGQPDQIKHLLNGDDEIVYFNEDQGQDAGIHGRNAEGQFYTILEGPGLSPETSGLSWDPSGKHMYVAFQEVGILFDITRSDGYPFSGTTLDVRYHNQPSNPLWLIR